jgi:hypothetical protein
MTPKSEAIQSLARRWYAALDTHEPTETLVAMLDPASLTMVFPEATLTGLDGFAAWYEGVIRIFFDEAHHVESVTIGGETAEGTEVGVVVRWEASRWKAPAPRSERIMLVASQTWTVAIGDDDLPRITRYTVDRLDYLPGSATL